MRIGIVGCGFIGTTIASALELMDEVVSINLLDVNYDSTLKLCSSLKKARPFPPDDVKGLIEASDLVVEAASQQAVKEVLPGALGMGKDVMVLSVGALVDETLWGDMRAKAKERGVRIFVPSGAIAGVDGIGSASIAEIESITLTVTKPPEGLSMDPSLHERAKDLKNITEPVVLFEGPAREAVSKFPKNVNVAAAISLAGIGFDRTVVRVVVDPSVSRNQHRVEVKGRFGAMSVLMQNLPSTTNPRTSYLAPLSAISTIRKVLTGIYIGN